MNIVTEQVKDLVMWLSNNLVQILVCIGLIVIITNQVYKFLSKSKEEKIAIVKAQIKNILLKLVADAEMQYLDVSKAGAIKRAKVIKEIFEQYPILSKVVNQESLIAWLDEEIDNALIILKGIINKR